MMMMMMMQTRRPSPSPSPSSPSSLPPVRDGLVSARWEALGTSVVLRLTDSGALEVARETVERELDAIDRACSRFRADSELSRVNSRAGRSVVVVSPLLIEAVEMALSAAELTGGDVDPTVGAALELAGYDRDWRQLVPPLDGEPEPGEPEPRPAITARVRAGWRTVTVNRGSSSIHIPTGMKLDLGATAKAWAADRAARAVYDATGAGVLVSLGGDIATAGVAPGGGWRIRVTDDHRSDLGAPGQTVSILSGGLATSSTTVRRWSHEGRNMHHIIDPATGAPIAGTWRTVSVAAASCTDANIATTAALVRADGAPAWLEELRLPARLVNRDGNVLAIGDWPAEALVGDAEGEEEEVLRSHDDARRHERT